MFGVDSLKMLVIFLGLFLLAVYWLRRPKNLPPGPRGWPLLGSLPTMYMQRHQKLLFVLFNEWAGKYGAVFSVRLGPKQVVVLNKLGCIKEALLKQSDVFAGREPLGLSKAIDGVRGSIAFESGPIWKERRRFAVGALRHFGMGKRSIESSINEEARYLLECFSEQDGKPLDPVHNVNNAVANIICKVTFGYRFEYTDPKFEELLVSVRARLMADGFASPLSVFPWLASTPLYSGVRERVRRIFYFIREVVQEHRSTYDANDIRDVIDMHLSGDLSTEENEKAFGKEAFTDEVLSHTIESFFIAGSDTTTKSILWILLYMCVYPAVQKKVQAELDEVVGKGRQPQLSDRSSMPYTTAVIWESMRITPIAPITIPYVTEKKTTLEGYKIPKKSVIFINLYGVLHDPDNFPDPETYNPDRFLSPDKKTAVRHEALIPFSIGRRACLGENLAKDEMFLFLTNILQQFSLRIPEGSPTPTIKGIYAPQPYTVCASKRD